MELDHSFVIPAAPADVITVLLDADRVRSCLPGLLSRDGAGRHGVDVRIGPVTARFDGGVSLLAADRDAGTLLVEVSGDELDGTHSARVTVRVAVSGADHESTVALGATIDVTGAIGRYGDDLVRTAAQRLAAQFATNLGASVQLGQRPRAAAAAAVSGPAQQRLAGADSVAAPSLLRRLVPVLLFGALSALAGGMFARSRRRAGG